MAFDITTLRPKGTTAQHLIEALNRASLAQSEQAADVRRLQQERDELLLDGSAAAMTKADTALAASRETLDKIVALVGQLDTRLAVAQEAEMVAQVAALRVDAEAKEAALATWWTLQRKKLASELSTGVSLLATTEEAQRIFGEAATAAVKRYPHQIIQPATTGPVNAHGWLFDLADCARMADTMPNSFDHLLRAGDPKL